MIGNTNVPLGSVAGSGESGTLPSNGVYIRDTNGKYWTVEAWDGSTTPTCIAVITDDCAFGIALNDIGTKAIYSDYFVAPDLPSITSAENAILDYDGLGNTSKMMETYGADSTYAAGSCANFTFPNGQKGYLCSAGELQAVLDNKAMIDIAFEKVGGESMTQGTYWTSTRATDNDSNGRVRFWQYVIDSSIFNNINLLKQNIVRAFCTLDGKGNDESEPDDSVTTNPSNGVYIQSVEGKFYTESEWDGTKTPNGIAVITDNCSFVMALEDISTSMPIYNDCLTYPDLSKVSSSSSAILDYDGVGNTQKMIAVYGTDSTYAAGACTNFTFPNGKKGYLGAAGEWNAAIDNKSAINTAMSKVGGTQLPTFGFQWSSTRAANDNDGWCRFWSCYWGDDSWDDDYVLTGLRVRAFMAI